MVDSYIGQQHDGLKGGRDNTEKESFTEMDQNVDESGSIMQADPRKREDNSKGLDLLLEPEKPDQSPQG